MEEKDFAAKEDQLAEKGLAAEEDLAEVDLAAAAEEDVMVELVNALEGIVAVGREYAPRKNAMIPAEIDGKCCSKGINYLGFY